MILTFIDLLFCLPLVANLRRARNMSNSRGTTGRVAKTTNREDVAAFLFELNVAT